MFRTRVFQFGLRACAETQRALTFSLRAGFAFSSPGLVSRVRAHFVVPDRKDLVIAEVLETGMVGILSATIQVEVNVHGL